MLQCLQPCCVSMRRQSDAVKVGCRNVRAGTGGLTARGGAGSARLSAALRCRVRHVAWFPAVVATRSRMRSRVVVTSCPEGVWASASVGEASAVPVADRPRLVDVCRAPRSRGLARHGQQAPASSSRPGRCDWIDPFWLVVDLSGLARRRPTWRRRRRDLPADRVAVLQHVALRPGTRARWLRVQKRSCDPCSGPW